MASTRMHKIVVEKSRPGTSQLITGVPPGTAAAGCGTFHPQTGGAPEGEMYTCNHMPSSRPAFFPITIFCTLTI